jgi:hypothetical protein
MYNIIRLYLQAYQGRNVGFTTDLQAANIPPYVLAGTCTAAPVVTKGHLVFTATVNTNLPSPAPKQLQIDQTRLITVIN